MECNGLLAKKLVFLLAALLGIGGGMARAGGIDSVEPYEIGESIGEESFWRSDPVLFVRNHQQQGFKFTSEDRRATDSRRENGVTCFGVPVYETRVAFRPAGGIERVELMLFNRGGTEKVEEILDDSGKRVRHLARLDKTMSREEFFRILNLVRTKLTPKGRKVPPPQDERTRDASVHQRTQVWSKSALACTATLSWNYTQKGKKTETFQPSYMRLALDAPGASETAGAPAGEKKSAKSAAKIVENVVRDPRGDVFIDQVPMVDQGMKGYCAVAAAERVMRYYGLDVDEHEIAEVAGTSAERGTPLNREMKEAVERIGRRYRLGIVKPMGDFDEDVDTRIANLTKEVADYNKAAKKLKKSPIVESQYVSHRGNVTTYNLSAVDKAMDAEVLKEMKTNGAQKSKYTTFKKTVRQYVDKGMPLYWSVTLGIYPEPNLPQGLGGHMRLIIGYNDKKDEILYTDTWGQGHELKRMPSGWAWAISKCLMVMKPLN